MTNQQTTNTRCWIEVAKRLSLSYEILDKNGNFVRIKKGDRVFDFANYSTPFNTDSFCKITKDKEFTQFLLKDVVKMPKTIGFIDPDYDEGGEIKAEFDTTSNMAERVSKEFNLPVVIKPNSLSGGKNFFLCKEKEEIETALNKIFSKDKDYDYLALAQEYVESFLEYRVLVFQNEIVMVYTRKTIIEDTKIVSDLKDFLSPIFLVLPIGFAGLDVLVGKDGKKYLLEINSRPGFANFVKKNGEERLINLFKDFLIRS